MLYLLQVIINDFFSWPLVSGLDKTNTLEALSITWLALC